MVGHQRSVSPREVRFTQDSISEVFGDHGQNFERESIEQTFKNLLYGDITVNSIRPMAVVQKDGHLWVVSGNRRLYVFRKLQEFGRISQVTVNVVPINMEKFQKSFTTKNQGQSIGIRQDRLHPYGDKMADRLNKIQQQWIRHGRPTDGYPVQRPAPSSSYSVDSFTYPTRVPVETRRSSDYVYDRSDHISYTPPQPQRQPQPPPNRAKDDSWCAIL